MIPKTISTILPCHNGGRTLDHAMKSVKDQSHPPIEVLILDDASTDHSRDGAKFWCEEWSTVRLLPYAQKSDNWVRDMALNALKETTGDYLHFLSVNDGLAGFPGRQNHLYEAAQYCWRAGIIMADWLLAQQVIENGEVKIQQQCAVSQMPPGKHPYARETLRRQLAKMSFFEGGCCALVRRDVLQWLCDLEYWDMGTWQDSVGYSAAAWLFGIAYIPYPGGVVAFDPNSWGERKKHDLRESLKMLDGVERFLEKAKQPFNEEGLPDDIADALFLKAYNTLTYEAKHLHLLGQQPPEPVVPAPREAVAGLSVNLAES